ncbi:type-F conjugative transfer system protein TrbI [Candidatus Regiella endosymbiont of Tuberolachnus salignus]|uniref:type-F conjugative transfer system protein TrbI n=1 Tax=Candidatus Regiella endosymbiont of Tuberolachnus salignus TaxID=3077956 RepID=UPI0030D246DB
MVNNSVTPIEMMIPKKAEKKWSKRRRRCVKPVVIVIACMMVLHAAVALLLIQWQSPVIVTFDMKETVDSFMDQSAKTRLSPAQTEQLVDRFNRALDSSLAEYRKTQRAIILVAPSVVSGARDITAAIQQDIARRMRTGRDE